MEQSEMKNLTLWAICHSQLGILPFDKLRAGSLRMKHLRLLLKQYTQFDQSKYVMVNLKYSILSVNRCVPEISLRSFRATPDKLELTTTHLRRSFLNFNF